MKNKKRENSVKSLINLYTVVMGVALSLAITNTIASESGLRSVTASSGLLFVAFLVTLFPFYHGALRHLDDAYIENDDSHIRDGALVFDVLLLLLHGIGFVVLSILMSVPNHFAWTLVVLLSVDVAWGIFAHYGSSSKADNTAEWKWAIINFIFIVLSIWYLVSNSIYLAPLAEPVKLSIPIAIACCIRTVCDYLTLQRNLGGFDLALSRMVGHTTPQPPKKGGGPCYQRFEAKSTCTRSPSSTSRCAM